MTGMIKWGQKSKPQKIPKASNKTPQKSLDQNLTPKKSHAEFPSHQNFVKALNNTTRKIETLVMECLCLFIHYTIWELLFHESSDCLEYPKKSLLKSSDPKKILGNIFLPKKIPEVKNFKPQLKSFDHPCHLKSRVPPWSFSDEPKILLFNST